VAVATTIERREGKETNSLIICKREHVSTAGRTKESEAPSTLQLFEVPCPSCGESSFNVVFKPSVTHRLLCPKCKVAFYVHVKRDLGVMLLQGDEYKKMLCPSCKGTGRCRTCKGTGEMMCPECRGVGYKKADVYESCGRCGGDGSREVGALFFN